MRFLKSNFKRRKSGKASFNYGELQKRELMAGNITFGTNWVAIHGTSSNDTSVLDYTNGGIKATINGTARTFSTAKYNKVYFYGYQGDDLFVNNTSITTTAYGYAGADRFYGGSGVDVFAGHSGNDRLFGRGGNDRLYGGSHHDYLHGGSGNDILAGGTGNDHLTGRSGRDQLFGEDGNDKLYGGTDADILVGGNHHDLLDGYFGDDKLYGGSGNDTLKGGPGNDLLSGNDGYDRLFGHSGNDNLYGGNQNDELFGGSGSDYLSGGAGMDGLFGGIGYRDRLNGGSGSDRLLHPGYYQNGKLMTEEVFINNESKDAHIMLMNGGKNWTDSEVIKVDKGLEALHVRTGSTRLLKDSVSGRGPLKFFRKPGTAVAYSVRANHHMYYMDGTFNHGDEFAAQTVIHEIGHNWDEASESGNFARTFQAQSGWSTRGGSGMTRGHHNGNTSNWFYRSTTRDFARAYGQLNPYEDFATSFASYFMDRAGIQYQGTGKGAFYGFNRGTTNVLPQKLRVISSLVSYLT